MHILNKCRTSMTKFTARHNEVAKIISEELQKKHFIVNENSTIQIRNARQLPRASQILKPDLWWIDTQHDPKTLHILEISVPYNQMTDHEGEHICSLDKVRRQKTHKYQQLCDDATRTFNMPTKLHVLIVSSLGVIPKMTITELKNLFGETKAKGIAKEIVNRVLHESAKIFFDTQRGHQQPRNNAVHTTSTSESTSDDSIEEETPEDPLQVDGLFHPRTGTS